MNLIKSTLAVGMAFGAICVNTSEASAKKIFKSGMYAGFELGYSHEDHKYKETRSGRLYFNAPNGLTFKSHKNCDVFLPGIFAGYRYGFGSVFLGAEVSANLNFSKSKASFMGQLDDKSQHVDKAKYNVVSAFVIGMPLSIFEGTAAYGKFGYDIAKYDYNFMEFNTVGVLNKKSRSKNLGRFLIGGGVEYSINKSVSTRFEITHSFAKNAKFKINGKTPISNSYNTSIKTTTTAVKVGLFSKI